MPKKFMPVKEKQKQKVGGTDSLINTLQYYFKQTSEAVVQRCSVKKVFLEISQNSQESTCARVSFLIKLQARPATLLKKRLWYRCFPVNFAKFLRTPFSIEHLWWLLLRHSFPCFHETEYFKETRKFHNHISYAFF